MKTILLCFALLLSGYAVAATIDPASNDAATINRWFDDVLLIISRLKGLIEPILALGLGVMLALQAWSLRRQKVATAERGVIGAVLANQDNALSHITQQVQTVKESVNGLTAQAVNDARTIGQAEGIASVIDPAVAEQKAIGVLAVAAADAKGVVLDAAVTAKDVLSDAANKDSP
jgi:hypothetical protein